MLRILLFSILLLPLAVSAQFTLTGPRGMVNVPHAELLTESTFMLGMHTNTQNYFLIDYGVSRQEGDEYVTSLTIGFLKRVNLTLMLSRIFGDPKQTVGPLSSIGDRSMQLTILALKEKGWRPSVVVNLTDPYSTNEYLAGNHIVATKTIINSETSLLKGTFGYGFPFLLQFAGQENRIIVDKESDYLTNLFGGVSYEFLPAHLQFSLEYDGWNVNTGLGITLWERLSMQAYLQGFKYLGIGFNYVGTIH